MTRFLLILLAFAVFGLISCDHERDVQGNAMSSYVANCVGGGYTACKHTCENKYGSSVDPDNVALLNTCISGCATSCNIATFCAQMQQGCKSNCKSYLNECVLILGLSGVGQ
ncbi:hypothetical protein EHO59_11975 [Leptospira semungkisensis]|uniref:Uncharacterized protein n=1 Tax=Leptospira semungkisensis TaxID=2484985 RepID=A0A4R9FR64_9LEPT|nr:hypothetical protein [Leptospira semungkisensis]TGK00660.1 hypothetical protein EHO59_11975 [Leptospira semungkisensis]